MTTLDVLLDGVRVAVLDGAAGAGLASLTYTEQAVERFGTGTPLLSTRLPVRAEGYPGVQTRAWLDGLLPEGDVRTQLADRARLADTDLFGLLGRYGRDCAGAVSFVDPADDTDATASDAGVHWLTDTELATAIRDLPRSPFGVATDRKVRVSLGGVQGKLAVVLDGERFGLPLGTHPSTHILKPAPLTADGRERWPGIASAEAFAMLLCRQLGLPTAPVQVLDLETGPALLVERYDRQTAESGVVRRLHQEDLCQALGLTSVSKYQHHNDEPSLLMLVQTLRENGGGALTELTDLLGRVTASVLAGNCDAHAKNWSFLLIDGSVRLAPVYDVVPTALWDELDTELALRVGDAALLESVRRGDLQAAAQSWGLGRRYAEAELSRIEARVPGALDAAVADANQVGADDEVVSRAAALVKRMCAQVFTGSC